MSARSLNKVMLIGNLTRDPELRYTPAGTAVVSFGLATNRGWTTESGERKEETEFHRIVAWNKLAELCSQLLAKGRKVFVEGRLQTRSWVGQDGNQRTTTEIVIDDMIILDSRRPETSMGAVATDQAGVTPQPATGGIVDQPMAASQAPVTSSSSATSQPGDAQPATEVPKVPNEDINPDDIPF